MLHTAQSYGSPKGDSAAPLLAMTSFEGSDTLSGKAITVSSLDARSFNESSNPKEMVAMTTQATLRETPPIEAGSFYSADLVVLALGLVGVWMLVVGGALLARRVKLVALNTV